MVKDTHDRDNDIVFAYRDQKKTLEEVGEIFNLTRERVRQILKERGVKRRKGSGIATYRKRACLDCGKVEMMGSNKDRCDKCGYWKRKRKEGMGYKARTVLKNAGVEKKCFFCLSQQKIETHHIDTDRTNNNIENLVYLCRSCHHKIHHTIYPPYRTRIWKQMKEKIGLDARQIALVTGKNGFKIKKAIRN